MISSPGNTVGFVSDTSHAESAPVKRFRLIYAFSEGFVLGFILASAVLMLVYFGIIWKVNNHE